MRLNGAARAKETLFAGALISVASFGDVRRRLFAGGLARGVEPECVIARGADGDLIFRLIGFGIRTFEPIVKSWVDALAFVEETIGPNQRDAVVAGGSAVGIGAGHQVENASAIRSADWAKHVFVGSQGVERHVQILDGLAVY
jgi:hypothetical protein